MNSEFLLALKKAKCKFSLYNLFLWLSRVRPSIASRSKQNFRSGHMITSLLIGSGRAGRENIWLEV